MKLSTLVHYRNMLDSFWPQEVEEPVKKLLGQSLHLVESHQIQFQELVTQLRQDHQSVHASIQHYCQTLEQIRAALDAMIAQIEPSYFVDSYRLYDEEMRMFDSDDHVLNRRPILPEKDQNYLRSRINRHANWKYPALIVRPGIEEWITGLVACDPLYLVDYNMNMLRPALDRFNELYQSRLRTYTDMDLAQAVRRLPSSQFGFCLIYNVFNYLPLEHIKDILTASAAVTRPGGTICFTINDCDRVGGVEYFEQRYMCYTPQKLILALCENLGYTITHCYEMDNSISWIEAELPGNLVSLRGGQTLAEIVYKGNEIK